MTPSHSFVPLSHKAFLKQEKSLLPPVSLGARDYVTKHPVTDAEAKALVIDFVAPALDTTILASTHLLWVLARHPESWQQIREDATLLVSELITNAASRPMSAVTRPPSDAPTASIADQLAVDSAFALHAIRCPPLGRLAFLSSALDPTPGLRHGAPVQPS